MTLTAEKKAPADRPANRIYYDQIDALKGIAIFLVILGHSIILYPIDLHRDPACNFIFRWLSSVHMPLFFVVSGFCYSCRGGYQMFVRKKCRRLLIPYFVFNLLDMVPRYLFPGFVNRPRGMGESVQKMFFYGGEYWFLYTLFLIFLIYPFIDRLRQGSLYRSAALLAVLLMLHFKLPTLPLLTIGQVIHYLFFFTVGVILKERFGQALFAAKWDRAKTAVLAAVLLLLWLALMVQHTLRLGVTTALVGIVFCYVCTQYDILVRIFRGFGRYSLQLYLFNGYLLVISRTTIVTVLGVTAPLLVVGFNMLVDLLLSYLVIKYVCTRIPPARMLMGMG